MTPALFGAPEASQAAGTEGTGNHAAADTAQTAGQDSVVVSLITCSPGEQVYELYGHTAIRVREVREGRQSDWVFNYGTFSFNQPHFMWRFVLGETDYQLGVLPYTFFYDEFVRSGRSVREQRLNLTPAEEKALVDALSENLLPANATYRYNFFYDNCTTRAVNMIEKAVRGKVVWPEVEKGKAKTLRDIVHEFSDVSPWNKFGQDLLLGAEADRPANRSAQMFAPLYAERFVAGAMVTDEKGESRLLAEPALTLLPETRAAGGEACPVTPMMAFSLLLAVAWAFTLYEWKRKTYYWQFDVLLFLVQGLAGCIVTFLFLFSAHPAVGSNYLVALFNPLPLVFFPWFMRSAVNGRKAWGMYIQAAMLLLTVIFGLAGLQQYPLEVYLIIFTLTLRVAAHFNYVRHIHYDGVTR